MKKATNHTSILDVINENLPAHTYALQLQQHAARIGFDWNNVQPVFEKLHEEILELQEELSAPTINPQRLMDEFGDILFVCVNIARHLKIDPEQALQHANQKFEQRFRCMEQLLRQNGLDSQQDLVILEQYWQQAKNNLE